MLTVEAKTVGRRRELAPAWGLPLPPEWAGSDGLTLRDVIARIVREQVAGFHQRQIEARFLRVLTEKELEDGSAVGRITPGGSRLRQPVEPDDAVARALLAFEDGLYLVLIDERRCERLDEPVELGTDSTVTFIRLVALAGG